MKNFYCYIRPSWKDDTDAFKKVLDEIDDIKSLINEKDGG